MRASQTKVLTCSGIPCSASSNDIALVLVCCVLLILWFVSVAGRASFLAVAAWLDRMLMRCDAVAVSCSTVSYLCHGVLLSVFIVRSWFRCVARVCGACIDWRSQPPNGPVCPFANFDGLHHRKVQIVRTRESKVLFATLHDTMTSNLHHSVFILMAKWSPPFTRTGLQTHYVRQHAKAH